MTIWQKIKPRPTLLPPHLYEVKAPKWHILWFLKSGRTILMHEISFDSEKEAKEFATQWFESYRTVTQFYGVPVRVFRGDGTFIAMFSDFSHFVPVPAKEGK